MGPPKFGAPGNCPICPPLKPALHICIYACRVYAYTYTHTHCVYIYAELGSIADTVSIKAKNQYRRYICNFICIYYKN